MNDPELSQDEYYMRRALSLAANAGGRTSPNPLVGCVIVNQGKIVGEGFHQRAGTPHAEVLALETAAALAGNATLYVTLEPCNHTGRTPPCTKAIIQAGVQRVVAAMVDPNPLVSGQGIEYLRAAGLQVEVGVLEKEARQLNEAFIKVMTSGLPWVVYKAASTLDGKIATASGDSQWISNERSRALAHRLRDVCDVIMAGSETVVKDDPALTCRVPDGRDPVRVVVDGRLRLKKDARLLTSSAQAPCVIATTQAAAAAQLAHFRSLPRVEVWQYDTERYVPLERLLRDLAGRGWNSVLLEGGGELAGKMIAEGLVDKLEFFIAPKLIGGHGPSPLAGLEIARMSEAISLTELSADLSSGDLHITAYIQRPDQANEEE
ncbi:MAG: bifunctional diaminohydroxyphosphoribosylaminopyrimidine deaminase/5-amino-6-(5-phosphoribosylamino)uracil reductase RibD [Peptococcaceae bacterium]|jgi:diaminohydroxyphosphoribosylaminopyrimidine deaminase/5-amino-6-(5-phosphoribosylamino)uracil reductase|nr:bifunctional diaminohydroxyphosphoribosylaminopyrimidine deaminase/5-amino-6-(5-phosphoribosylamino)uracil reductase RibD [Peptococcaceae bacterium]